MAEAADDPNPESTTEDKSESNMPDQSKPPTEDPPQKPETTPEDPTPTTIPDKPKPPSDETSSPQTIFDILKDKWNSVVNNPYRMKVIFCAMLFLFALEMARELKHIAIPMFLYRPFRKVSECLKCLLKIICN